MELCGVVESGETKAEVESQQDKGTFEEVRRMRDHGSKGIEMSG